MDKLRRRAPGWLAAIFGVSSAVHLLRPTVFISLIPGWLPNPRAVVYVSGVAELICAVGLVTRARWARSASTLVLVAVFPGNIQMAVNSVHEAHGRVTASEVLTFLRLPLQIPLVWAALQSPRSPRSGRSHRSRGPETAVDPVSTAKAR